MNNIYITGFMGTGKTAAGKALSAKTGAAFIDLDDYIEALCGLTITRIFRDRGEAYFRKLEKESLAAVSSNERNIVSCGGGIVVDPENVDLMRKTGVCVCLSAEPEEILRRISSQTHRPLLEGGDPLEKIKKLLSERQSFYERANIAIDTTGLTPGQVADLILSGPAGSFLSDK